MSPSSLDHKKPLFLGGALSFKGEKKNKAQKKKSKTKHTTVSQSGQSSTARTITSLENASFEPQSVDTIPIHHDKDKIDGANDEQTPAERAAQARKRERQWKELQLMAQKSHRERVEAFNEKLSQLTEHNDIPRVSAAGNG